MFIWDVLPVQEPGWIWNRDQGLYKLAEMAEQTSGPFKDDPDDRRLDTYRLEQGTRVKRSLVITSEGDASTWLLDPETILSDGEWEGGRWSSRNPAMGWQATGFNDLMKNESASFVKIRG